MIWWMMFLVRRKWLLKKSMIVDDAQRGLMRYVFNSGGNKKMTRVDRVARKWKCKQTQLFFLLNACFLKCTLLLPLRPEQPGSRGSYDLWKYPRSSTIVN